MSSTLTLVTLLRPWIRCFMIIISAWLLRTSSKFTWEEVKTSTGKLGKCSTPKRVRICPKHSVPSLSRDRRMKMHQSINQSINLAEALVKPHVLSQYYNPSGLQQPTMHAITSFLKSNVQAESTSTAITADLQVQLNYIRKSSVVFVWIRFQVKARYKQLRNKLAKAKYFCTKNN